ncbi:MAG: helix-turn-helix domain-containing protein [Gammaproteobacteria bacterium]|nr:helix-turn-helix domain-containing protein [Gammaproteobacteria bacterium]MDH5630020.1 helix-turn-helix domain-containing protein [Gammaproteobacteria bacterium]
MIVKRLRDKKNWSQEQLAIMTGLSTRTIQRIESGNKASIESLKSLAAVFEVDISKLEEEIDVIDKQTEEWRALPWWFRFNVYGIGSRKQMLWVEYLCALTGLIAFINGFYVAKGFKIALVFFVAAYIMALVTRYGDTHKVW